MPGPRPPCRHCGVRVGRPRDRGMCGRCYRDRAIRALYPSWRRSPTYDESEDMTDAELDALILRQLQKMPARMVGERAEGDEEPPPRAVVMGAALSAALSFTPRGLPR